MAKDFMHVVSTTFMAILFLFRSSLGEMWSVFSFLQAKVYCPLTLVTEIMVDFSFPSSFRFLGRCVWRVPLVLSSVFSVSWRRFSYTNVPSFSLLFALGHVLSHSPLLLSSFHRWFSNYKSFPPIFTPLFVLCSLPFLTPFSPSFFIFSFCSWASFPLIAVMIHRSVLLPVCAALTPSSSPSSFPIEPARKSSVIGTNWRAAGHNVFSQCPAESLPRRCEESFCRCQALQGARRRCLAETWSRLWEAILCILSQLKLAIYLKNIFCE